jgi:glycosyltransferase involved in cell wall biosynthesis
MSAKPDISVVIPVGRRYEKDVQSLYTEYKRGLLATEKTYEIVYVIDGPRPDVVKDLRSLLHGGEMIKIVQLAKTFGEATALTAGFKHSTGGLILTLPAYYQVQATEIPEIVRQLEGNDMVVGRRWPRTETLFGRFRRRIFHGTLNSITGSQFRDLGCGVRAFKRNIVKEVPIYGDQHRFFPVLAERRGFRVKELDLAQSNRDHFPGVYQPGLYLKGLLDIFTVFFLVKFTKKPLRFFGMIGTSTLAVGGLFLLYIVVERLIFGVPLSSRPAMLLSSLLVVLGVQITALGLIGELIIFTHAKQLKEYAVEEVLN